jgi:branched-chain amino acid transport system substrate-binding protein
MRKEGRRMGKGKGRNWMVSVSVFFLLVGWMTGHSLAQPKPIKVGVSEVLTGPTGIMGELSVKAIKAAAEVIKDEGGLIDGRNFEIKVVDNEANVENTLRQVRRFVESEGYQFVIVGGGTHLAKALQNEASKLDAVFTDTDAMSTFLRGKSATPNVWLSAMPLNIVLKAVARRIVDEGHTGLRWVGLNPDYAFGHDSWEWFTKYIKEFDPKAQIGKGIFHPFREANMIPYIEKAIEDKPTALYVSSFATDMYNILEQGSPRGLFKNSIMATYDLLEVLKIGGGGDVLPDTTFVADREYWEVNPNHPSRKKYQDKYWQMYGEKPVYLQSCSYNALYMIAEGVRKARTTKRDAVVKAMEDMKFEGAHGSEVARAGDRQVQYPYVPTYILKKAPGEPKPAWLKVPKGGWKVVKPMGVAGWYPANMFESPLAK